MFCLLWCNRWDRFHIPKTPVVGSYSIPYRDMKGKVCVMGRAINLMHKGRPLSASSAVLTVAFQAVLLKKHQPLPCIALEARWRKMQGLSPGFRIQSVTGSQ